MSNESKVAVITGASQGMGAALVKAYRDIGFRVVANSRSIAPSNDPNIINVAGDIANPATAERIMREGVDLFGRIDTLVNNAGIFTAKPFTQFTLEDWERNIATNLAGFFHISQRAIERMERLGGGHVVQITTSIVDQPINGVPAVLASITKGGLNAATKSLAIEYASRNIRVNAVAPGIIKTAMHPPETHSTLAALHPVGRMGEISDIVNAVLFLEKSSFITGEILHVDGGQAAGHW
jgi:NAD(P)-dependent dehydrogenase (short-subunit alcohol dehydrogenase family)